VPIPSIRTNELESVSMRLSRLLLLLAITATPVLAGPATYTICQGLYFLVIACDVAAGAAWSTAPSPVLEFQADAQRGPVLSKSELHHREAEALLGQSLRCS
jgi:hypothetical protein